MEEEVVNDEDSEMKNENEEEEITPSRVKEEDLKGDQTVIRRKIHFFNFWPKRQLRSAWLKYLSAGSLGENLNAAYICI